MSVAGEDKRVVWDRFQKACSPRGQSVRRLRNASELSENSR